MFKPIIFLQSFILILFLFHVAAAQSDDEINFFDPDFVFEMVDPGFCAIPPISTISDKEIIDMLNSRRNEIPIQGEINGAISGTIFGGGYYKIHDDGLTASFSNMILTPDHRVLALCMVILPVNDTTLTEGTASLAGPVPEIVTGQTYLAITRISERDESGLKHLGELNEGSGHITFHTNTEEELTGNLVLDGRVEGISSGHQNDIHLHFYFEEMIENPLRNLRWTLD